jgi:hypothetical protein
MRARTVVAVADSQDGAPFVGRVAEPDLDRRSATGREWRAGYRALKRPATFERSLCDLEGNCVPGGRRMGEGVETPGDLRRSLRDLSQKDKTRADCLWDSRRLPVATSVHGCPQAALKGCPVLRALASSAVGYPELWVR